jgi:FMN reductase
MADIVTIAGSPSSNSRSAALLASARQTIACQGFESAAINVRDLPPEDLIYGRFESPAVQAAIGLVRAARGVIVATPIYKASLSGVLKTFLDLLPTQALAGKLVLPIATGGSPLHALAIDYALNPVLGALGAQHVLNSIYIVDSQIQFVDGEVQLDLAVAERFATALDRLIEGVERSAEPV